MVFSELNFFLKFQIISIHLCIKAVVFFEDTSQRAYSSVDTAPMSYALTGIKLWQYVLQVLLSK
jgi:hypothetical protein